MASGIPCPWAFQCNSLKSVLWHFMENSIFSLRLLWISSIWDLRGTFIAKLWLMSTLSFISQAASSPRYTVPLFSWGTLKPLWGLCAQQLFWNQRMGSDRCVSGTVNPRTFLHDQIAPPLPPSLTLTPSSKDSQSTRVAWIHALGEHRIWMGWEY